MLFPALTRQSTWQARSGTHYGRLKASLTANAVRADTYLTCMSSRSFGGNRDTGVAQPSPAGCDRTMPEGWSALPLLRLGTPLARRAGHWAAPVGDEPVPDSGSERQYAWDVAWSDAAREASRLGADPRTAEALAAGAGTALAEGTRAVVAAHGEVLLARWLPRDAGPSSVWTGPLPRLLEIAAAAARRPAHVVVLADRHGAAVVAHAAGEQHPRLAVPRRGPPRRAARPAPGPAAGAAPRGTARDRQRARKRWSAERRVHRRARSRGSGQRGRAHRPRRGRSAHPQRDLRSPVPVARPGHHHRIQPGAWVPRRSAQRPGRRRSGGDHHNSHRGCRGAGCILGRGTGAGRGPRHRGRCPAAGRAAGRRAAGRG